MFCRKCGKEIPDNANFCSYCGTQIGAFTNTPASTLAGESNILAVAGFILAFFVPIAGLICSILGRRDAPKYGGGGKGLATAGIVISIVTTALAVSAVIVYWMMFIFGII